MKIFSEGVVRYRQNLANTVSLKNLKKRCVCAPGFPSVKAAWKLQLPTRWHLARRTKLQRFFCMSNCLAFYN